VRALVEAMSETSLNHAEIGTLREEERLATEAGTIDVVPAWRWFLQSGRGAVSASS
jgi:hypothetical protein